MSASNRRLPCLFLFSLSLAFASSFSPHPFLSLDQSLTLNTIHSNHPCHAALHDCPFLSLKQLPLHPRFPHSVCHQQACCMSDSIQEEKNSDSLPGPSRGWTDVSVSDQEERRPMLLRCVGLSLSFFSCVFQLMDVFYSQGEGEGRGQGQGQAFSRPRDATPLPLLRPLLPHCMHQGRTSPSERDGAWFRIPL